MRSSVVVGGLVCLVLALFGGGAHVEAFSRHAAASKHHHRTPIIQLNGAQELIGTLREDERVVSISPHLSVYPDTGPICKYELSSAAGDDDEDLPFEAEILDKHEGTAVVRVRADAKPIDCSHNEYRIHVTAIRCADDLSRSEPVLLKITIKDTNNHAPKFDAPWYSFEVEEGKVVSEIARLYASDKDCGHPYGKICRYEITNALENFPFRIDDQGVISNTRPLNRSDAESHILTVVAYDCGMERSKATLVTVKVRRSCVDGLRNVPKPIDAASPAAAAIQYLPGSGVRTLMPDAELLMCPTEKKCELKEASVEVELESVRDADEEKEHVEAEPAAADATTTKKCGMNLQTVELLPRVRKERDVIVGKDGKEKELLLESSVETLAAKQKEINGKAKSDEDRDDGSDDEDDEESAEDEDDNDEESDGSSVPTERYLFDGASDFVAVPEKTVGSVVPERFTLAFSMKHARGSKEEQKQKQNILCETDEHNMNRHHFAIYIRHCKLELLLRREAAHASAEFRAAEWRWEMPEVCDNEWHSYAILFHNLDKVELFVDGHRFENTDRNPEILDDWPLHETKDLKTRLTVGACWHARSQQMVQHFKGRLQNMYLLTNEVEQEAAIECLHQPKERLVFTERLGVGESATFSRQQSKLTLAARSLEDLSVLVQKVGYVNTAAALRPGERRLRVTPTVTCGADEKRTLKAYETLVQVRKPHEPVLSLSGQNLIDTDRQSLKVGVAMLPDFQITITQQDASGKETDVTDRHTLDWCKLHLKPARDMDVEYFSSPAALIASMNVDFEHDEEGILLKGSEHPSGYREVFSKIHYFNTRPESYNKRMYTVQCSMGKILSNEFFVTMNIDGVPDEAVEKLEQSAKKADEESGEEKSANLEFAKHFEPSAFDQLGANRLQNILEMDLPRPKALLSHRGYEVGQGAVAGGAVAIVVVICVGFLLVLLVVGVLKMRDQPVPRRRRHRKNSAGLQQEGMEWDDGGLGANGYDSSINITVNPLEDVEKQEQVAAYSEEESSDDGESYHDEDEYSEDEDEPVLAPHSPSATRQQGGLEWDDESSALQASVSRTYRV